MRAVDFRRQEGTFDFARRFRFAYSLEHYNKVAGKLSAPTKTSRGIILGFQQVTCGADYSTVKHCAK